MDKDLKIAGYIILICIVIVTLVILFGKKPNEGTQINVISQPLDTIVADNKDTVFQKKYDSATSVLKNILDKIKHEDSISSNNIK